MIADSCANPDCTGGPLSGSTRDHWVQIEEVQLVGSMRGEGPVQRRFSAVTCSKRCAAVVLASAADVDDTMAARESERLDGMFPQPQ
ncbi:MAG: hypothetical protein L0I76_26180 [Pseudonocardia sp.]|nr:hypothetical protein [Pseudonocardia sp.]